MSPSVPEPWAGFLRDVDRALDRNVEVRCLGGFVMTVLWDLPRPTGDIDVVEVLPSDATERLMQVAGEGSELSERYRLRFDHVTVAQYPSDYMTRLLDVTPEGLERLRVLAFDAHDLVLAKVSRNSPRDREDARFLAGKGAVDRDRLREIFDVELRPYLLNAERDVVTLEIWLAELFDA